MPAAMALPPSDTLRPLSGGTTSRSYEFVGDVVIELSTQLKLESYSVPNSAYSSPRLGSGLSRSKSCGEGRGRAPPHGLVENRVAIGESEEKARRGRKAWRFRCGALCLLLPGFGLKIGKGKGERKEEAEAGGCISISISRRVSLEKFECGSWASSGMVVHEDGEAGMGSLYFDLPMELIRNSVGAQTQTQPVKAAFVFDRDGNGEGVYRLPVWTKGKLAEESSSPSPSPCIITPRLRKARREFNALLEAHTHTL